MKQGQRCPQTRCPPAHKLWSPEGRPVSQGLCPAPERDWQAEAAPRTSGEPEGLPSGQWAYEAEASPPESPGHPQSFTASPLKPLSAQKGLQHGKSPSGTRTCLPGASPAELLFFFSREIKAIVSTLGPSPSDLKQIAYATQWLGLGTARSDPGV